MADVKDIFLRAVEMPSAEERAAYLEAACVDQPSLRTKVEALLAAHDDPESYLERPAARFDATATTDGSERGSNLSDSSSHHGRFLPGTRIADRYRIVSLLGRGGMGEVYRADDLRLGQTVALKFLPPELAKDAKRLDYFHNEVRLARQISHPNICRVYDIGEVDGQLFISMEYIDGEDLKSLLGRIGRLPNDKGVQIAQQLCAGLSAAHANGVLHRDLKPANIMLDGQGQARITDFGLATTAVDGEFAMGMSGTPGYMAPEQLLRGQTSVQSDVYSLGLILYELFSGRSAFDAQSLVELRKLHADSSNVRPPSSHAEDVDPVVEHAILLALDHDPEHRPKSAAALAAALPGGNPLEAAIAAGETPSPELVAAAGTDGVVSRKIAIGWLMIVILCLAGIYFVSPTSQMVTRMAPIKSPEVYAERSRQIMKQFGYDEPIADFAFGFDLRARDVLHQTPDQSSTLRRWDVEPSVSTPGLYFWYRDSPAPLFQNEVYAGVEGDTDGRVTFSQPAFKYAGMRRIKLDATGRLLEFAAVPRNFHQSGSSPATDWGTVLTADLVGHELSSLQPAEWRMPTSVAADHVQAWEGTWPGTDEVVYMQAASFRGRVSEVRFFTEQQMKATGKIRTPKYSLRIRILVTVQMLAIVFAATLAFRNLTFGRGDTKATKPLATWAFSSMMLLWLFKASHVQHEYEFGLLMIGIRNAAGYTLLVMTMYFAFEPLARKGCPELLVSWTRMLRARSEDRLVGRDILVGCLFGVIYGLLRDLSGSFGVFAPRSLVLHSLGGLDAMVLGTMESVRDGLIISIFGLVAYLLILSSVRSKSLAVVFFGAILSVLELLANDAVPLGWCIAVLLGFGQACFFARVGLLAALVGLTVIEMLRHPITSDTEAFYYPGSLTMLVLIAAIALYGYRVAAPYPRSPSV